MSRDANGSYSRVNPPGASGYQPLTVIKATEVNSEINDLGQEITNSIDKGGRTTPTANLPMGGFKHTGAGQGSASGDYVEYLQWTNARLDGWVSVSDSWTYASADSPVFVITVPTGAASKYAVGYRIKLTQTTVKYFIIVAVTDTTLTVYGGTDYTLANAAISSISVSNVKCPLGFPVDPSKWTVRLSDTSTRTQSTPVQNTYYNLGSLSLSMPIGCWVVKVQLCPYLVSTVAQVAADMEFGLSTSTSSFSDTDFKGYNYQGGASSTQTQIYNFYRSKTVSVASKTTNYLIARTTLTNSASINFLGATSPSIVEFLCAYL